MARVLLDRVVKRYGAVVALDTFTLEVQEGEFLTLLGPSGCGKTTTLRIIAGFIDPTEGRLLIDDDDVTALPPQKRGIGMVFQDYALFPHLTIEENVAFGLVERRVARDKIKARVKELLDLVHLPGVESRYPSEISGGQQQRIAVARAVAYPPKVLLMDEPLGALDLKLREAMQFELRRIQQELGITTVYVTHDQHEAMTMSDRIAVMNLGRLEQLGTPTEIYNRPKTRFVADFVGKINFLSGRVVERAGSSWVVDTPVASLRVPGGGDIGSDGKVTVAVRPENLRLMPQGSSIDDMNAVPGVISSQTFVGNLLHVVIGADDGLRLLVEARPDQTVGNVGDAVLAVWKPDQSLVLSD
jgi:spermidine/putrescine ABC transporter ATP-binding subunit